MEKFVSIREGWSHMMTLTMLASSVDTTMIRTVLFIMILVAVALLLAGSVIALLTLYKQFKTPTKDEAH